MSVLAPSRPCREQLQSVEAVWKRHRRASMPNTRFIRAAAGVTGHPIVIDGRERISSPVGPLGAVDAQQRSSCPQQPHLPHRLRHSQNPHHPLQVVCQHVQTHLRAHMHQGLGLDESPRV